MRRQRRIAGRNRRHGGFGSLPRSRSRSGGRKRASGGARETWGVSGGVGMLGHGEWG